MLIAAAKEHLQTQWEKKKKKSINTQKITVQNALLQKKAKSNLHRKSA